MSKFFAPRSLTAQAKFLFAQIFSASLMLILTVCCEHETLCTNKRFSAEFFGLVFAEYEITSIKGSYQESKFKFAIDLRASEVLQPN